MIPECIIQTFLLQLYFQSFQAAIEKMLTLFVFILIVVLPALYVIFTHISFASSRGKPLPPGPRPWPIVGNLLSMGKLPHISASHFSEVYGPIISLRLGTQFVVIASSPTAAAEILKTNDRFLSARKLPKGFPFNLAEPGSMAILWANECNEEWRSLRALYKAELFSAKAIESQAILREKKVGEMVEFLRSQEGRVINIGEVVFTVVFNTLTNVIFSKDLTDFELNGSGGRLKSIMEKMVLLVSSPNVADFYPFLARLDPQGIKRKGLKIYRESCDVWANELKQRREGHVSGAPKNDLLDIFLENGFEDHQIYWLLIELVIAGSDTTIVTVEWAMVELIRNQNVLKKICEELQKEMNKHQLKESHVSQLPYLEACVKETLRLHPPAPFLLPRRAVETCEVMNYTIPKDSQVFVNVWAIGRDPLVWEDPLSFNPERFLDSNMDFKGQHYEFLPFGGGRRICPGLPMATKQVALILASLLYYFDWSVPNGGDPSKLDVNEKFGVLLQKEKHLLLVPHQKS